LFQQSGHCSRNAADDLHPGQMIATTEDMIVDRRGNIFMDSSPGAGQITAASGFPIYFQVSNIRDRNHGRNGRRGSQIATSMIYECRLTMSDDRLAHISQ
jgi:hypothetical protein